MKKHLLNFMFLVSPNDKRFYSYLGTSGGLSQMKIVFTSYYQNIAFRNNVLSQKFQASIFLSMISCYNFAIRNKLQKSSEIKHLIYTAGVWPTYLFVAASIILLQCLCKVHKSGTNLRNDEI